MISITHLLGSSADEQTRQIHRMLVEGIGPEYFSRTKTVGLGGNFRNLPTAILRLRHLPSDITYAWGIQALAAAVISRQRRIFFSPDRFAGKNTLRWIRSLITRADVTMICPTFTQQRLAIAHGIAIDRCQVIQPGVDFGRVRQRSDPKLRQLLGYTDTDIVLLAPGETDIHSGHKQAIWTCGILNVLDPAYKLLLWGRGDRALSTAHLAHRLKQSHMVTLAEQTLGRPMLFEELLNVADLCVITGTGVAPTLPIATVMAGGLPIVSAVNYTVAELLEDRHTALMVPKQSPRALVQRVLDLRADPGLQVKLVETARAEAYEHFSMTRMLDAYRRIFANDPSVALRYPEKPDRISGNSARGGTAETGLV